MVSWNFSRSGACGQLPARFAALPLPCDNRRVKLVINGAERDVDQVTTLASLIEQLGMKSDRVAVELNRQIVSRDRWTETPLFQGDRLEIVHFVGGGL